MLVHENLTAQHTMIGLKMRVPVLVAEHDIRSAVGAMLVGAVEEPAKGRLNSHDVEVIAAHFLDPGARRTLACVQSRLSDAVCCQTIEAAVAIAQLEIVGI